VRSSGRKLAYASVVMCNTTQYDYMEVPESRLSGTVLKSSYYPKDGFSQLFIYGNASAGVYQRILRYVKYRAPLIYSKSATTTRFWRNVTFQVANIKGELSNVGKRTFRIDAGKGC
jgi:hypothetical protein